MAAEEVGGDDLLAATVQIVRGYVSHHPIAHEQLEPLVREVAAALRSCGQEAEPPKREPAVPVYRSVQQEHLVCFECGKPRRLLRRHLARAHGLTPGEYREKWGLAREYPMSAPDYAQRRSELAKKYGLGRRGRNKGPEPEPKAKRRRGKRA